MVIAASCKLHQIMPASCIAPAVRHGRRRKPVQCNAPVERQNTISVERTKNHTCSFAEQPFMLCSPGHCTVHSCFGKEYDIASTWAAAVHQSNKVRTPECISQGCGVSLAGRNVPAAAKLSSNAHSLHPGYQATYCRRALLWQGGLI